MKNVGKWIVRKFGILRESLKADEKRVEAILDFSLRCWTTTCIPLRHDFDVISDERNVTAAAAAAAEAAVRKIWIRVFILFLFFENNLCLHQSGDCRVSGRSEVKVDGRLLGLAFSTSWTFCNRSFFGIKEFSYSLFF